MGNYVARCRARWSVSPCDICPAFKYMNEREKTSLKFFFSLVDTKKKRAKDRSLSSARRARPAQKERNKVFCHQRLAISASFNRVETPLSTSPEHKRKEIQKRKRERERKENKKDKSRHTQYFTSNCTCCSEHSSRSISIWRMLRDDLVVAANTLHFILLSLSFLFSLCVFFILEFPNRVFFSPRCVKHKNPTNWCVKSFFLRNDATIGRSLFCSGTRSREILIGGCRKCEKSVQIRVD